MTTPKPPWNQLKAARALRGNPSLAALAKTIGVTREYLSRVANGRDRPSPQVVARLADALDMPASALDPQAGGDSVVEQIAAAIDVPVAKVTEMLGLMRAVIALGDRRPAVEQDDEQRPSAA